MTKDKRQGQADEHRLKADAMFADAMFAVTTRRGSHIEGTRVLISSLVFSYTRAHIKGLVIDGAKISSDSSLSEVKHEMHARIITLCNQPREMRCTN